MIAVRIGPDFDMAVVAAPDHDERFGVPDGPEDLVRHPCINLILGKGTFYRWAFAQGGRSVRVAVEGPLALNSLDRIHDAALAGIGLGFLPLDQVGSDIEGGRLVRLLDGWSSTLPGYHLYYPDRRFASPAFRLLIDALRHRPR
jgi:DNA-binding transcriptional LysR family regulator